MDWFWEMFRDQDLKMYMADKNNIVERTGPKATGGPLGHGDPYDRSLNKYEEEPLIPQRVMDISKTVLCKKEGDVYDACIFKEGAMMLYFNCIEKRNNYYNCLKKNFYDPEVRDAVIEEYLNERSHYRTTGIRQSRYMGGKFLSRDTVRDPPLDKDGNYRPQKPLGWDESYPDGPPDWAHFKYDL